MRAWKEVRPTDQLARCLLPVFRERRLQLLDDGALDAHVGVAPVLRRATVARPLPAHARPTGDADATVDDEQPSVVAIVVAPDRQPPDRPERLDAAPGALHRLPMRVLHRQRADAVEQHARDHARTATLGERLGDLRARLTLGV